MATLPAKMTTVIDATGMKLKLAVLGQEAHKVLYVIAATLFSWIDRNFKEQGIERPWTSLRPETIARRRQGGALILQDTGRLRQSFVIFQRREEASIKNVMGQRNYVDIGTADERSLFHHLGTRRGLPSRPIWPSSDLAQKLATQSATTYLDLVARRLNGR